MVDQGQGGYPSNDRHPGLGWRLDELSMLASPDGRAPRQAAAARHPSDATRAECRHGAHRPSSLQSSTTAALIKRASHSVDGSHDGFEAAVSRMHPQRKLGPLRAGESSWAP